MSNGFRYFNRFQITAFQGEQWLLRIPVDAGPGLLEFWSPDALVQWTVTQSEDGFATPQNFRTGPASRSSIYLPRGGEVKGEPYTRSISTINEYNGFIGREPSVPQMVARFYPEMTERPKIESVRFVAVGALPWADRVTIPPGLSVGLAYPPHYAQTALVSSDETITVYVVDPAGNILQNRNVNPVQAVPFVVAPYCYIVVTTLQLSANINLEWSEDLLTLV